MVARESNALSRDVTPLLERAIADLDRHAFAAPLTRIDAGLRSAVWIDPRIPPRGPRMSAEPVLIENGLVFDGTGAPAEVIPVALERTIQAVGPAALDWARDRASVRRIDASGMTVMPGLIDAHCHISFDEPHSNDELFFHRREGLAAIVAAYNARKVLRAGVTSLFDADSIFSVSLDLRDAIEAGIAEGPRMACGGNALFTSVGGTAGMLVPDEGAIGYLKVTGTRDEIVTEIRRQAKRGVDWIKIHVTGIIPRQRTSGEIQVWNRDVQIIDVSVVKGHRYGARRKCARATAQFKLAQGKRLGALRKYAHLRIEVLW